jgi:hypothetical protein
MTHQGAPSRLRGSIDHDWTDMMTDSDFQSVILIGLIGFLITTRLTSAFLLDDNAINSIAMLG